MCSEYVQIVFRVCSECVQSLFRMCSECVQSLFRVCSEFVQSVLRVCLISSPSASSVSVFGIFFIIMKVNSLVINDNSAQILLDLGPAH